MYIDNRENNNRNWPVAETNWNRSSEQKLSEKFSACLMSQWGQKKWHTKDHVPCTYTQ